MTTVYGRGATNEMVEFLTKFHVLEISLPWTMQHYLLLFCFYYFYFLLLLFIYYLHLIYFILCILFILFISFIFSRQFSRAFLAAN